MISDKPNHSRQDAPVSLSRKVTLSPWVNEPLPDWEQLLSTHDVARLTRRPRWVVLGLTVLGRFPRKRRFHGRRIGWLRSDVFTWLTKDLRAAPCYAGRASVLRARVSRRRFLPLGFERIGHSGQSNFGSCARVPALRRDERP